MNPEPHPGSTLELTIEKPAAGGRMIARHQGRVIFVLGAIPGERVLARVEKAERQLAFATTSEVLDASPDRREPFVDLLCGGSLYAHIAYPRQLRIKADVIGEAFTRLGRIEPPPVNVLPSPEAGYRMRGRLHVQGSEVGFYREGTHALCDAASARQLTSEAVAVGREAARWLRDRGVPPVSIQISENLAADERALHVELRPGTALPQALLRDVVNAWRLTGCSARAGGASAAAGDPSVADPLAVLTSGRGTAGRLSRRAESFFQANRHLLPALVGEVLDAVATKGAVLELYAGVGLFSLALASSGRGGITAVEGDRTSGADLLQNASQFTGSVRAVIGSVEGHLGAGAASEADAVIVDPPRTGISKAAMQAVVALGARQVVYVSCDPPTMARDARRLLDGGYALSSLRAFDLFPNTPHVEVLGAFVRGHA